MADSQERLRDATPSARSFDPRAGEAAGAGTGGRDRRRHRRRIGRPAPRRARPADTVVLERGRVACGTSWHAAGLVTRTRASHVQTELAGYSRDFYESLAARSGPTSATTRAAR